MNVTINPSLLHGKMTVPPSKSVAHRLIIAAALADGESRIGNLSASKDITATINAMKILGADIVIDGDTAIINGIKNPPENAVIDCCESGSTLRFLIPVVCALGVKTTFLGRGKLPERPITPYLDEFPKHNVTFDYNSTMPFAVNGKLTAGKFYISGSISSQFITGLIFGLMLADGESEIILTSPLQSKPYVDITVGCLESFGGKVDATEQGYLVHGGQKLHCCNASVEGDYSQSAFFYVANSLGSDIIIDGLNKKSIQGDKKIVEICCDIVYNNKCRLKAFEADCSDIPDLVPILTVLATFCEGKSRITNVARLRIKECDRLAAMTENLNKIGGKVTAFDDCLEIEGVEKLNGGEVYAYNDHRIAMSMAIAATRCSNSLKIIGAECVTKSYPDFFDVYKSLGGNIILS